jgi:hypothetical protein
LLVAVYVAWQGVCRFVLGITFSPQLLYSHLQYLDFALMEHDLLASLWFQHSQPPLMGLMFGAVIKLWPAYYEVVLELLYFLLGLAGMVFLCVAMARLGVRLWVRQAMLCGVCVFPSFYLYGHWLYTAHVEFALCALFVWACARMTLAEQVRARDVAVLCAPLCLLGLVRPQWHLMVVMMVPVGIYGLRRGRDGGAVYAKGMAVFAPLLAVYAKNFVLFGFFGASSWLGINLSSLVTQFVSPAQLESLRQAGVVHAAYPVQFDGAKAEAAFALWRQAHPGEMVLDHPALAPDKPTVKKANANALAIVISARQDLQDSLAVIAQYPWPYAQHVTRRLWQQMWYPSLAHNCCYFTVERMGGVGYGQWPHWGRLLAAYASFAQYGVVPLVMLGLCLRRGGYAAQRRVFIVSGVALAFAMMVIACALNGGEQERMRWGQAPIYTVLAAMAVEAGLRRRLRA